MYKTLRKCLFFMLVLTMSLFLMTGIASAENQSTENSSIKEYVKWLEKESGQTSFISIDKTRAYSTTDIMYF